jgi:hypothetical protein
MTYFQVASTPVRKIKPSGGQESDNVTEKKEATRFYLGKASF